MESYCLRTVSCFICSTLYFGGSSTLITCGWHICTAIPLLGYSTIYLTILSLMNIWVVPLPPHSSAPLLLLFCLLLFLFCYLTSMIQTSLYRSQSTHVEVSLKYILLSCKIYTCSTLYNKIDVRKKTKKKKSRRYVIRPS